MPNGHDKNFIRLCAAIDGFRAKYGAWPTKALLPEIVQRDLRALLGPELDRRLRQMLPFEASEEVAVADDRGHVFRYGTGVNAHGPRAAEWLGISVPVREHARDEAAATRRDEFGVWSKSRMDIAFYDHTPAWEGESCEVRISESEVVITYEEADGEIVEYRGKNDPSGHARLRCPEWKGETSMHRSPGSKVLEGFWIEDGEKGFWRIQLKR